ncbi:MAG: UbiD family decarboxylase [Rhodospirillaceae bacterium]|jgi:2,5-furandicarboxylate decarboxylase 1|nr:UbiD family decarboxylase [Rhodospirillaceae bacterium]MBT4588500.1 UbiD family decarboxylase [Rhodospirillaceae bacterium]MBT7266390.1 UbiD family decarboxylase [Rhodospirillaceae bacterium]
MAKNQLDPDLRGYLETNKDILTVIEKQVSIDDVGALSAQSEGPILFENIKEHPGFRLCDMLVKHRWSQARALGVAEEDYLPTLAQRLRKPPRGLVDVETGPVKEVIWTGKDADWLKLPIPIHSELEDKPYVTAMNIVKDPETGFYNSSHAGTQAVGPHKGLVSFITPHTHAIIRKYLDRGEKEMPIAVIFGIPPAYEIMGNFSGLHMDLWGEMEMVGTIMDIDIEMVPCETIPLTVPAHAEIVVEATVDLTSQTDVGVGVSPSMYYLPKTATLPDMNIQAITMRKDRPIYRNHLTTPDTDHQTLPRLCHEAVLYNRLTEIGVKVHDIQFPTWGAALSCVIQLEAPRAGFINDALMQAMGAPWLNTKMVVAVSPDTDIGNAQEVYHAIATRCDPSRDMIIVDNTRGSPFDPSGEPIDAFWRTVGKIGIDATAKSRNLADHERAWPLNWGKVDLKDYL